MSNGHPQSRKDRGASAAKATLPRLEPRPGAAIAPGSIQNPSLLEADQTNPAAPPPSEIDLRALIGEIGGPGARLQRHIITELVPKEAVHHDWQVLLAAAEVQRKWDREEEEAKHVKKAEKPAKKMRDPTAETPCVYLTCNMPEGRHGINCIGYKTREEEEQEAALEKARAEMLDLDGYPF